MSECSGSPGLAFGASGWAFGFTRLFVEDIFRAGELRYVVSTRLVGDQNR